MAKPEYPFRTDPFRHQREEFDLRRETEAWAHFWEQGTGKSKQAIDETSALYLAGRVNGMFIMAPNGVHRNWVVEEIPTHMPEVIQRRTMWYSSDRHNQKGHQAELERLMNCPKGELAVLAMSFDSMMTEHGRKAAKEFLMRRKCMYIVDEARRIKDPAAKRTKRVLASSKYAPYRRVLNGTPFSNGPFDVYSQVKFLDENFWDREGIGDFLGFKVMFGVFGTITGPGGRSIQVVRGYRNLELLGEMLKKISTRITKDDVLDLPPKIYTIRSFELTREQERVYDQIIDGMRAEVEGGSLTVELALTRTLRLQQVACGYLPVDMPDGSVKIADLGGVNPRLKLLQEIIEDLPHKTIIWARFRQDIDKIMGLLGDDAVRYDGSTDEEGRAAAIEAFQRGGAQFFVANPSAAGEGLTLHAARSVVTYSSDFNLATRLQAEDRAHRIGQLHPVNYTDLCASGTVDEHVVRALIDKKNVADVILGEARSWLGQAARKG